MKVYRLATDTSYRLMYPVDDVYGLEAWEFKGQPRITELPKLFNAYFDEDSDKPYPDIALIGMSAFAFHEDVVKQLLDILEPAGELIPFYVDNQVWYLLNTTNTVDAVNPDLSEWSVNNGQSRFGLKSPVFDSNTLNATHPVFKVPSDNFTHTYCVDKRDTDDDVLLNLFCAITANNFKGLKFEVCSVK